MRAFDPEAPDVPVPGTRHLGLTAALAVVGLVLAFAALVPSIVGVLLLLPLLLGLQRVGLRGRQRRLRRRRDDVA